jgi:hypothetical protein
MRHLLFLFIGLVLMACGANNSNSAQKRVNAESDSVSASAKVDTLAKKTDSAAVKKDTMTAEEVAVAKRVGAIRAIKMAEDTFKVIKLVSPEVYKSIMEWSYSVYATDSMPMTGVVSGHGKWLVPLEYNDVHQLTKDAFVGHLSVSLYEGDYDAPAYAELYQVVYRGKPIGNFTYACEITPIVYRQKAVGFIKTFYNANNQQYFRYYIDNKGKGWDAWVGVQVGSYPHFEYYKINGNVLTLWGGAKKPEDLAAFFPEDRSLYKVDLRSGRVLENPFVPVD